MDPKSGAKKAMLAAEQLKKIAQKELVQIGQDSTDEPMALMAAFPEPVMELEEADRQRHRGANQAHPELREVVREGHHGVRFTQGSARLRAFQRALLGLRVGVRFIGGLVAPGGFLGFVAGAYDPLSRRSLLAVESVQGAVSLLILDHDTLATEPFNPDGLEGGAILRDAPMVVHPVWGALGVGGRSADGVTRSGESLFGQTCP